MKGSGSMPAIIYQAWMGKEKQQLWRFFLCVDGVHRASGSYPVT